MVVTIVILIILATVGINAAFGENGIIKQAEKAKDLTSNAIAKENEDMNELLEEYANIMAGDGGENPGPEEDTTPPTVSEITTSNITENSITVTVNATDNESGIAKYQFEYKLSTESDYKVAETVETTEKTCSYEYTGLLEQTTYKLRVTVFDKSNNQASAEKEEITLKSNSAPSIETAKVKSKTTNSLTVTVNATDIDNDKLIYTLYTSKSPDSNFEEKATSVATEAGTNVDLTAQGLEQYTYYYYKIDVTDGKDTTDGLVSNQVRTYCPGTGFHCNESQSVKVDCDWCWRTRILLGMYILSP